MDEDLIKKSPLSGVSFKCTSIGNFYGVADIMFNSLSKSNAYFFCEMKKPASDLSISKPRKYLTSPRSFILNEADSMDFR